MTTSPTRWWTETARLRFIERDGRRILQQAWEQYATFEPGIFPLERPVEWRDVPLVTGVPE